MSASSYLIQFTQSCLIRFFRIPVCPPPPCGHFNVYDLDSLITSPTKISSNKASCLDVILTNVTAFMKGSGIVETGMSTWEVGRTLRNLKLLSAIASSNSYTFSCSPNLPRASTTQWSTPNHDLFL